jgi:hypothetical protein
MFQTLVLIAWWCAASIAQTAPSVADSRPRQATSKSDGVDELQRSEKLCASARASATSTLLRAFDAAIATRLADGARGGPQAVREAAELRTEQESFKRDVRDLPRAESMRAARQVFVRVVAEAESKHQRALEQDVERRRRAGDVDGAAAALKALENFKMERVDAADPTGDWLRAGSEFRGRQSFRRNGPKSGVADSTLKITSRDGPRFSGVFSQGRTRFEIRGVVKAGRIEWAGSEAEDARSPGQIHSGTIKDGVIETTFSGLGRALRKVEGSTRLTLLRGGP